MHTLNTTKDKYRIFFKLFTFILPLFFLSFDITNAATLNLISSKSVLSPGEIATVKMIVNTEGISINTAEAKISFPNNLIEVLSVNKLDSFLSIWVEEPSISNTNGTITFNGGIPTPGYSGNQGSVISFTIKAKKSGQAEFVLSDTAVRANDGFGTNVLKSQSGINLSIKEVEIIPEKVQKKESTIPTPKTDRVIEDIPEVIEIMTIDAPNISYHQNKIESGKMFEVYGNTYPLSNVTVQLKDKEEVVFTENIKSDSQGKWAIMKKQDLNPGTYTLVSYVTDLTGLRSLDSSPLTILVYPNIIKGIQDTILKYLSLIILIIVSAGAIVSLLIYVWNHTLGKIRKMNREAKEADQVSEYVFKILKNGVKNHTNRLKKLKRKLNSDEVDFLEKFDTKLDEAENIIRKEIKDISKK